MKLSGSYFYGNQASEYARENGYLDYATLAKAFDAVLNNDIMQKTQAMGWYWDQESGTVDNSDEIRELEEKQDELETQMADLEEDTSEWEMLNKEAEEIDDKISDLEEEQKPKEIFQFYIVSDEGARILKEIDEIVFYNEELDMYVWGVTHCGTNWSYVLTDVKLNCGEEAYK